MAAKALRPDDLRKWLPLATLAALILMIGIAQPSFLQPSTLIELASDTAVLFILATGVTFVIMLGGIDLSIQSMASLASVIVALTVARLGYGSFLLAIVIGAIAGLLSGIVHVRLKIPSFIATLAMGGVLFIDEAYYLYRPENERDYGQEAIEILLQVMENQRDDLVVILAGYRDRMETFFRSNPGLSSRIAHHLDFPDYSPQELEEIAARMLESMQYRLSPSGSAALREYIPLRMQQAHFANARSIRNALDRARLRQANRLFERSGSKLRREELMTIEGEDIRSSRVFARGEQ